jgi:hypothetical protein
VGGWVGGWVGWFFFFYNLIYNAEALQSDPFLEPFKFRILKT